MENLPHENLPVAGVVLSLLGPPTVLTAEGRPLATPPGAKALALLAYLALESRPHTREELAGLLWGESPEHEARASLRQALKQLRAVLGEVIRSDRASIELAGPIECDVVEFRRLVVEDPRKAVAGDIPRFLAGFSVRHAPRFEEWVGETRHRASAGLRALRGRLGSGVDGSGGLARCRGAGRPMAGVRSALRGSGPHCG